MQKIYVFPFFERVTININNAEGETRTPTPVRALPPQDSVSTNSTTSANGNLIITSNQSKEK